MKATLKRAVLGVARRSSLITKAAVFIAQHAAKPPRDSYRFFRERFINNGKSSAVNESTRQDLVGKFERIDREVKIATTPTDGLVLAEMLFNLQAEGDLVECGCYAGGSSAKLSLIASLLHRKLVVFDSFEGLPVVDQIYVRDPHCRRNKEWTPGWRPGRYAARQDVVQDNLKRYGEASVCTLVKGWFSETLTPQNLPKQVCFVFSDVDMATSARDCLTAMWPLLSNGGVYVTHDTAYIKVLQELYNPRLWSEHFKSIPPILFGAGYGLCNDAPHIGYMVKGESLSAEYLKSLTIDK